MRIRIIKSKLKIKKIQLLNKFVFFYFRISGHPRELNKDQGKIIFAALGEYPGENNYTLFVIMN